MHFGCSSTHQGGDQRIRPSVGGVRLRVDSSSSTLAHWRETNRFCFYSFAINLLSLKICFTMIHLIKDALQDTGASPCGGYNQEETLTPLDFDLPPDDPV